MAVPRTKQLENFEHALYWVSGRRSAIDVGAHDGEYSRVLAREFAHVTAFEPQKDLFAKIPQLANLKALNAAAGSEVNVGMLKQDTDNPRGAYVVQKLGGSVEMLPIDDLGLLDVDLIKIDVEGFEIDVLLGARHTISACKPALIIEWDKTTFRRRRKHRDYYRMVDFLAKRRYQLVLDFPPDRLLIRRPK